MKATVYIETSVISYRAARSSTDLIVAAHQQITDVWWTEALPKCVPYVSPVVMAEIERGDSDAAQARLELTEGMAVLDVTDDVAALADQYFRAIDIPHSARADSFHLALATCHGMDYLVTWNCRHIAAGRVRGIVERVNAEQGIATPLICTPEELMEL